VRAAELASLPVLAAGIAGRHVSVEDHRGGEMHDTKDAQPVPRLPEAAGDPRHATPYAWYALGVMTVVYLLNFVDRQILSILAEQIRGDLGLDDAELGFLFGTAFAVFYALFGIPLGRLADRWHRGRLMALGLALWSTMTALSGFASSFAQLAIARVGVGIGEASASPAAFSLLGDHFPKRLRALANSIYSSGLYLGMGLSLPLGGAISMSWNAAFPADAPLGLVGWQVAFVAVGLPGLVVAVWVWYLREPERLDARGRPVAANYAGVWRAFLDDLLAILPPFTLWSVARFPGGLSLNLVILAGVVIAMMLMTAVTGDVVQWAAYGVGFYAIASWIQTLRVTDRPTFSLIWGTPEVLLAIVGFGGLAGVTYCVSFWTAPYAIRTFGLDAHTVGAAIGIPGALAAAAGVILGGRLSDAWRSRDPRGRLFTCMIAAAGPAPFLVAQYHAPDFTTYALLSPVVYAFANMWVGSAVAAYQDFVLPRMYGTVSAVYLIGGTMIGLALGPYGTGKVATVTGDLRLGVLSMLIIAPITLACLWRASRRMAVLDATKAERAAASGEVLDLGSAPASPAGLRQPG